MKTTVLLFLSAISVVSALVQDGICDLPCPNEAPCVFANVGTSTYMHCDCPLFRTGLQCQLSYDSCSDSQHVCLHGGTCQTGLLDSYQNVQTFCNCDTAVDSNGVLYIGKYCEHPSSQVTETSCTTQNQDTFCLNGGVCNNQYPNFGKPCLCTNRYTGDRCEYLNGDKSTPVVQQQQPPPSSQQNQGCNLPCHNGGYCVNGTPTAEEKPYPFWPPSYSDSMYCKCPDNFEGPGCEIPKTPCGDYHCFFGSTCMVMQDTNGQQLHHCDCSTATRNGVGFAGRFCQFEAEIQCPTQDSSSSNLFCVNGGTCKPNAYEGCECPAGFTGFSCEFQAQVDQTVVGNQEDPLHYDTAEHSACDMPCQNGGTCRHGTKQNSQTLDLFAEHTSHLNNQAQTINNEHCVCPESYTGTYCEHAIMECGEGEYLCAHGSKCVQQGSELLCDCDEANSQLASFYAGSHCEHPVNDICTEGMGAPDTVRMNAMLPMTPMSFCVNGGRCKKTIQPGQLHPGCFCLDGYTGPHCELREAKSVFNSWDPYSTFTGMGRVGDDSRSGFEKAVLSLSIIAIVVVAAFSTKRYQQRRRERNHAVTSSINWQRNYRDEPSEEINIAPKRGSVLSDDQVYEQATIQARRRSSQDPLVAAAARTNNIASAVEMVKTELALAEEDGDLADDKDPEIYIGPPRDEDGHELHNVEIV